MITMKWKPLTAGPRREQTSQTPKLLTTFRKGTRWLDPELVGQPVSFVDETDGSVFAIGTIVSVKAVKFGDIDPSDHARQTHEMMTPEKRLEIMQRVYGDDYGMETLTTVVTLGNIKS